MTLIGRSWIYWLTMFVLSAAAGVAYSHLFAGTGTALSSAVYGVFIGAAVLTMDATLRSAPALRGFRAQASYIYLPVAEAAMLVAVVLGNAAGGVVSWSLGLVGWSFAEAVLPTPRVVAYSLVVTAILVFMIRVRDLIGSTIFLNLLFGRYHRPMEEERVFLFVDVAGSTAFAENHGDLAAQKWLSAVFSAIAEPVRRHGGAVEDYVGDLAIISWPMAKGVADGRCVSCLFDIAAELARGPELWREHHGQVPQVRAALHGGSVVTAEIGVDRHKIAYFGDVVNTTARLEGLSRAVGERYLISGDLLSRIDTLPDGIIARELGAHRLRGKDQLLTAYALSGVAQMLSDARPAGMPARPAVQVAR
jgi:adenylate cyclase